MDNNYDALLGEFLRQNPFCTSAVIWGDIVYLVADKAQMEDLAGFMDNHEVATKPAGNAQLTFAVADLPRVVQAWRKFQPKRERLLEKVRKHTPPALLPNGWESHAEGAEEGVFNVDFRTDS